MVNDDMQLKTQNLELKIISQNFKTKKFLHFAFYILHSCRRQVGFTLLELLLTFAIIAVLFAVTVLVINPVRRTKLARDAVRKSDLSQLSRAIEVYYTIHQAKELPAQDGATHFSTSGTPPQNVVGSGWIPADLSHETNTLPIDPLNNGLYFYRYYANPSPGSNRFKLDAAMEVDSPAAENDGGLDPARLEVGTDKSLLPP